MLSIYKRINGFYGWVSFCSEINNKYDAEFFSRFWHGLIVMYLTVFDNCFAFRDGIINENKMNLINFVPGHELRPIGRPIKNISSSSFSWLTHDILKSTSYLKNKLFSNSKNIFITHFLLFCINLFRPHA